MNKLTITLLGSEGMGESLAERVKSLRLMKGWRRVTLADHAGVSPASLKRFETTGKCSLELLLKVARALGRLDEFAGLLQPPPAKSIDELERLATMPVCKRGTV